MLGVLLIALPVAVFAAPKKTTTYAFKACFEESKLWSATSNQAESLLLQQTLKQISRQAATLNLHIAKPPIQLIDHCDDRLVVRYRLIEIRHEAQTWLIEERTPKQQRYLLMSFDGAQQLVVDTRPLFSEQSNTFAVVKTTVLTDALSTQVSIYRHQAQGWQREVEQWRIQPCPACEIHALEPAHWDGERLLIPRPKTQQPIRWIESVQWQADRQTWQINEF